MTVDNPVSKILREWGSFHSALLALSADNAKLPASVEGLSGALSAFFAAEYVRARKYDTLRSVQYGEKNDGLGDTIIVVQSDKDAAEMYTDLQTIAGESAEVYIFQWWGTVPYRPVAKGAKIFAERAGILSCLARSQKTLTLDTKPRIFIMSQRAFLSPVPSAEYIKKNCFYMQKGQPFDPDALAKKLSRLGYMRVPRVTVCGEFALRGEVLDLYTPNSDSAVRIQFDFDEIEHIKRFDVASQNTSEKLERILVPPMKEVIWSDELVEKAEKKLRAIDENGIGGSAADESDEAILSFTDIARNALEAMLTELAVNKETAGEELFYPLLWDKKYSVLDYIGKDATVIFADYDRLQNAEESILREYAGMYRKARLTLPVLPPREMIFSFADMAKAHQRSLFFKSLHTVLNDDGGTADSAKEKKHTDVKIEAEAGKNFFGNINYLKEQLALYKKDGWRTFIYADNSQQALRIHELLKDVIDDENGEKSLLEIEPLAVSAGFCVNEIKLLVIQENEIFGRRKAVPKAIKKGVKSSVIDTFVELNPGDYVVHVNYGIGRFKGIERIKSLGNERDYITLEYADEDFVYVPIEQVNMVQRYIGSEGEKPRLDKIGSKSWENRKNKVQKSVEELAEKLIDLYSRRKASVGFPFPKDTEWQTAFEAAFPYEDTADQATVSAEIKADMEKPTPMDRLVCGDVGYGKTEIAMRAAFKAVMGGKQVAFLAPTTILAEQHYETCLERFANFPVKIAQMSRFVSAKEQKKILADVAAGQVDILVGTHRIIQKDVAFKDLGLMIIDEEQRFGVKDKEKLKVLKNNIDCLSMSATPIPRTLHMSLLKIRDMSLLTTPPQNRQPIETVIDAYSDDKVAEAIRREVERGGQVFYLHNRVETLEETRRKLSSLLPEMMVDVAHGQMTAEQLDDIFRRFKMGGFHVLVATTIIENGIDIPNVNTIIIDRADMYGVSQLYQLRGRVGRSDRKAYAYLFYPENRVLSEIAMKRLQVISDFTELGSGFKIAMKDMEIRGAGNLLGRDQSGEVYSVGFDLYLRLLNDAVARLTASKDYKAETEVLLELEYTGFVPDSYVQNPQTKMEIYKKIAAVKTKAELDALEGDLCDRFGPVPDEVFSLLSIAQVRIMCRALVIVSLKEKSGVVRVEFGDMAKVQIDKVLRLIQSSAGKVKLDPTHPEQLLLETGSIGLKEKAAFILEKLESLV